MQKSKLNLNKTPRGVELTNRAVYAVEEVDKAFFASIGDELPQLLALLRKLDT